MIDMQQHLLYITKLIISRDLKLDKIRAVKAEWRDEDKTACISFYFDQKPNEDELEDAAVACTEIIAHFPEGFLEEHFIKWDYPKPLPEKFLAYKRQEKSI